MSIHTGSGCFIHLRRNLRGARLQMWRAPAPPAAGLRTCQRKSYNRSLLSQLGNPLEKLWPKFVKSAARVRNSATISVTPTTSSGGAGMSTCGRYAPKFRAAAGGCGSAPAVCAAVKLRKLRILGFRFCGPSPLGEGFFFPALPVPDDQGRNSARRPLRQFAVANASLPPAHVPTAAFPRRPQRRTSAAAPALSSAGYL
jgi:hypothetical protein